MLLPPTLPYRKDSFNADTTDVRNDDMLIDIVDINGCISFESGVDSFRLK